jgi:plasmid stabilization system protein ParE
MDIRLLDGAKEDLRNGCFFYERQSPGLGDRFLDAIEAEVQTLAPYAGIHLKVEGFYRMLIRRFPFALYYLIDDDTIAIYAILDCRRDPNGLRKRLGGSEDLT